MIYSPIWIIFFPATFILSDFIHIYFHIYIYRYIYICTYIYIYIYIFIYTCIHINIRKYVRKSIHPYIHTYIHWYMHSYIHIYICIHIHIYKHTYIRTYIHTYIHTNIYTCIRIPIQSYVHIWICTYIHTYIHYVVTRLPWLVNLATLVYDVDQWLRGRFSALPSVVTCSISSRRDHSIHCWWYIVRSKQLSCVSICRTQGLPDFLAMVIQITIYNSFIPCPSGNDHGDA